MIKVELTDIPLLRGQLTVRDHGARARTPVVVGSVLIPDSLVDGRDGMIGAVGRNPGDDQVQKARSHHT